MSLPTTPGRFSFHTRPIHVPGDLRIEWRVSLIALMLGYSRSKQASLAKLHVLNDAVRTSRGGDLLDIVVNSRASTMPWTFRVEPAFARAIDFVVGDKLAAWTVTAGRAALQLTDEGVVLFDALAREEDVLQAEKAILSVHAKSLSEALVTTVLSAARKAA